MQINDAGSREARFFRSAAVENMRMRLPQAIHRYEPQAFDAVVGMRGAWRKFRRMGKAVAADGITDLLAELDYALVFRSIGFEVVFEPNGDARGPDFAVAQADQSFVVEVRRFRPTSIQAQPPTSAGPLAEYERGQKDVDRTLARIVEKFGQLREGVGVLALWSDDDGVEELEVEFAVRQLLEDHRKAVHTIPSGLGWVVYASAYLLGGQQFFCYPLSREDRPAWCDELEATTVAAVKLTRFRGASQVR